MTFTELVTEVMERTRQTSAEASTRVGRAINDRYRRVTSSVGLATSRRLTVVLHPLIGEAQLLVTCEKVFAVAITSPDRRVLGEITYDQWRNAQVTPQTGIPSRYAVAWTLPGSVTLMLDPAPGSPMDISVDVLGEAFDLLGDVEPSFAASFHDILMHGALADEWLQLKQDDLNKRAEAMYEMRLSDLRMFIAKSGYLSYVQGGRSGGMDSGPYWPAYGLSRYR